MGAFGKQMEQNLRSAKMKERMRSKLAENNEKQAEKQAEKVLDNLITPKGINIEGMEEFIFSTGEGAEKSAKKKKKKPKGMKK